MKRVLPGVDYKEDIVPNASALFEALRGVDWDESMKARKTASFGAAYSYSQMTYSDVAMHPSLVPLVALVEQRVGFQPNSCLLNYYEDGGSSMGYHSDSISDLEDGTGVAVVSLGAERTLWFRRSTAREIRHAVPVRSGSLLYMPPDILREWQHALLPEPGAGDRLSLSFRALKRG